MKSCFCLLLAAATLTAVGAETNKAPVLPTPTHASVKYGPHDRNVLDFWQAKSRKPTPLLVFIHGGGWRGGDKSALPPATLKFMLDHGVSVAAINYRYSQFAKLPAPVHDAARAVQFLRSKAGEWNIRKDRVAATGGSAGACTTLWLAYHDDLANPKSEDPMERESTRLCAGVGVEGQTSIDPKVVVPWVGEKVMDHGMMWASVGAKNRKDAEDHYDSYKDLYVEFSPINHVSAGDPPIMLFYRTPSPLPCTDTGVAIHHAELGRRLKEKADAVGLECKYVIKENPLQESPEVHEFLLKYLKKK